MFLNYEDKEKFYSRALNAGNIVLWEWDLQLKNLNFSNNFNIIFQERLYKYKSLHQLIYGVAIEEDKKEAEEELKYLFKTNSNIYKSEFRIVNNKGNLAWISIVGNVVRNYSGEIVLISGCISDITENKKLRSEIKYLSYFDSLTGLPNRVMFLKDLKFAIEKWTSDNKKGALIYFDIDDFKLINDTYGQDYGDMILVTFSQLLEATVKKVAKTYRLSSDEFILLINGISDKNEVDKICKEIIRLCQYPFEVKNSQIYITTSIGISIFPDDTLNEFELYKYADLAVHESKLKGKSSITHFKKLFADKYFRKLIIEQELKNAIENNELYIVYQPQVNSKFNKAIGFEALLRWKSERLGNVSPSEFIPIAESYGIIVKIGEWVIENVCHNISRLNNLGYNIGRISINISPIQLRQKGFINRLLSICERNNVNPSLIEIEITENTLIDINNYKSEVLNSAIKRGFRIAVDDFGVGYSSLTYLSVLPISTLKIDKSFVDNIGNHNDRSIVKCIIELCKSLNYNIVAEGVEKKEQLDILNEFGCEVIQGYYYSKPLEENDMEGFIIGD